MPAYHSAKAAWGRLQLGKPVLGMVGPTNGAERIMQITVSGVHFGGIASIVPDGGVIGALIEPFPPQGTIARPSASCRLAVLRPHTKRRESRLELLWGFRVPLQQSVNLYRSVKILSAFPAGWLGPPVLLGQTLQG